MSDDKLTRNERNKMILGVCSGLADYTHLDVAIVRLAFLVLLFASGIGIPIYLALAFLMPHDVQYDADQIRILSDEQDLLPIQPEKRPAVRTPAEKRALGAMALITVGSYLLWVQIGLSGTIFWALVLIAAGAYFIRQQNRL